MISNNIFAYCYNNPVNLTDTTGELPKFAQGLLTVISGLTQTIAGITLGITVGWTGFGAVAAGFLTMNGAATMVAGGNMFSNAVWGTNKSEDNCLRAAIEDVDTFIWGPGVTPFTQLYDLADLAATAYSITVGFTKIMGSMKGGLSGTSAAPEITPNIVVAIPALEFTPHAVNFFDGLGGVIDAFRTAFSVFEE